MLTPPKCLIIGIKRFEVDMYGQSSKLTNRVIVPKEIDLAPYLAEGHEVTEGGAQYEVFAMQRHIGSSLGGGHYTARIQVTHEGEDGAQEEVWRDFDDSRVSSLPENTAYGTSDTLHKTENKKWEEASVFASHLIYSLMFVRKDPEGEDTEDELVRTSSCYFEPKPKPFKVGKWNSTSGSTGWSSGGTGWSSTGSYGTGLYATGSAWSTVGSKKKDDKLGSEFVEGYVWTTAGVASIPPEAAQHATPPTVGDGFSQGHYALAEALGAMGGMADFVSAGIIEKAPDNNTDNGTDWLFDESYDSPCNPSPAAGTGDVDDWANFDDWSGGGGGNYYDVWGLD